MTYFIDIDGTICHTAGTDYAAATPWPERIEVVNRLFDAGHTIVLWTARGSKNGRTLELRQLTKRQVREWGVKHHELRIDKPFYDVLVDDRALSSLMEVE